MFTLEDWERLVHQYNTLKTKYDKLVLTHEQTQKHNNKLERELNLLRENIEIYKAELEHFRRVYVDEVKKNNEKR